MRVFVVMENDFPAGVFASKFAAKVCIDAGKQADELLIKQRMKPDYWSGIHRTIYEFEVQK